MYQYPCDWEHCATCAYWSGQRQLFDIFGSRVEVKSPMDKGICLNRDSGCRQTTMQANGKCSAFEKWAALK